MYKKGGQDYLKDKHDLFLHYRKHKIFNKV